MWRPWSARASLASSSEKSLEIRCDAFHSPHGIAWIDEETIIVASRERGVAVIPVPPFEAGVSAARVESLAEMLPDGLSCIRTPGSLALYQLVDGYFDLLVCNNYSHNVSRHLVRRTEHFEIVAGRRFLNKDLQVPDGVAFNRDASLIAVSNHDLRRVDVFVNDRRTGTQSSPVCSLAVPGYPHGLRFVADDRLLLAADAGEPLVHVFTRGECGWIGEAEPAASIQVMDDAAFQRGRFSDEEGGPKGIDVSPDTSFFVVTCEMTPIAFFDFRPVAARLLA